MARGKVATRGIKSIQNKQIVLDTSIIILLADARYRGQIAAALSELETQGNIFYASEISVYELNKTSKTDRDIANKAKLLRRFNPLVLNQNRFILAGVLYATMKSCQNDFKNKENDIGCDMIIGGTVIENNNALLMTTNSSDFRSPCWKTIAEGRVVKKNKGNGWSIDTWSLLEFDYTKLPDDLMPPQYRGGQAALMLPPATPQ